MAMGTEETTRPQGDVPAMEQPGTEQPQVDRLPVDVQEPVAAKSYTQAEFDAAKAEVMSSKDKEIQAHRNVLERLALQQQIARAQQEEAAVQARDKADLEAGSVTEDEVKQRHQARAYTQQLRQEAAQIGQLVQNLSQAGDSLGMAVNVWQVAQEVAKEDKLTQFETVELFDKMMSGEKMTHPEQVKTRAASLRLQRTQDALRAAKATPETFASGLPGGTGRAIDGMTPEQKIIYGLTQRKR